MNSSASPQMTSGGCNIPVVQRVIAVMWPSFLMAGLATILFFTAFDPEHLLAPTDYAGVSRIAAYSIGFFLFWMLTASSCALTCYFRRPTDTIT